MTLKSKKGQMILAALSVLSAVVMVIALMATGGQREVPFEPPPFEKDAQTGVPQLAQELGYSELDCKAYRIGVCGDVRYADGALDVYLTNPEENNVWLKLRVLDESGAILGETGIIRPGEYVRSVKLDHVPPLGSPVVLKVMGYEIETYYSAGAVTLTTMLTEGGTP